VGTSPFEVQGRSRERRGLRRRHQGRINFALAGLLLSFLAVGTILVAFRYVTSWVEHSLTVSGMLERVQLALTEAESAQRGFILTGNRAYLMPYDGAVAEARWLTGRLAALTADNALQQEHHARLRQLVEDKITELMATVKAANLEGFEAARIIVRTDRGQQLMTDIRATIAQMAVQEGSLLATRDRLATTLFAATLALLAAFVGVAIWIGVSSARDREHDFYEEQDEGVALGRTIDELRERTQALSETEMRQNLLIRELHHRIRNMLATVQAIADATVRTASSVEAFREGFSARLSALGRTHGLITEQAWGRVALRDLIDRELLSFSGERRSQARLDGPDILVPSEIALGLGMAFHELMANAVKFGALSVPEGYVTVTWSTEAEADADILHLTWIESGGPMVETPKRFGFGTRLLKRVLGCQLNGQVRIDYFAEGVHVTFKAVLPRDPILGSGPLANAGLADRSETVLP
jgi:two-component sensor histidine kinase/CHASE3 domain sensor protein